MKKVGIFLLLITISITSFTGQLLQSEDIPAKFKVEVDVKCDDEITSNLIKSYIKRELRSLEDVIVSRILIEIVNDNLTKDKIILLMD